MLLMPPGRYTAVIRVWCGRVMPRQKISWSATTGEKMDDTNIPAEKPPQGHLRIWRECLYSLAPCSRINQNVGIHKLKGYKIWDWLYNEEASQLYHYKGHAVPSHHYVGRTGCHIYSRSARWCRTHLGYTRKVKHQMGIFQITTLVCLQGTLHWSM